MTWGEIQIESLKKMFLNDDNITIENLNTYKTNKRYKTYLFAMPQACNEAINYIVSALGTDTKEFQLTREGVNATYDLSNTTDLADFRKIKKVVCPSGVSWKMKTPTLLEINGWYDGNVYIYYEPTVNIIDSNTAATALTGLREEYSRIIPLYIAGELYKDDDLSMSTMYMNEFFNMINTFSQNNGYIDNPKIDTIYSIG